MKWLDAIQGKACIFDLDGTLLDSMHIWQDVDRKYLARYGISFDPAFSEAIKNMTFDESARYFIDTFHIPKSEEEIKADWNQMVEIEYRDHIMMKEYTLELIQALHAHRIPMCIATSCNKKHAQMALKRLGLSSYFDFILTCSEVGKNKQYPDIFITCANKMHVDIRECVVFDDLYMALKAAKQAGCKTIGVNDVLSIHEKEEMLVNCDRYIHCFQELLEEM